MVFDSAPPTPVLSFLARVTVELAAPVWEVGETTELGRWRIIPITGRAGRL